METINASDQAAIQEIISHSSSPKRCRAAAQSFLSGHMLRGRDPAQADENLYRYCGDAPTDGTDPSGLFDLATEVDSSTATTISFESCLAAIVQQSPAPASLASYLDTDTFRASLRNQDGLEPALVQGLVQHDIGRLGYHTFTSRPQWSVCLPDGRVIDFSNNFIATAPIQVAAGTAIGNASNNLSDGIPGVLGASTTNGKSMLRTPCLAGSQTPLAISV